MVDRNPEAGRHIEEQMGLHQSDGGTDFISVPTVEELNDAPLAEVPPATADSLRTPSRMSRVKDRLARAFLPGVVVVTVKDQEGKVEDVRRIHPRRPSSHTDRADALGLETRRHPLRGRGHSVSDYHQGSEFVPVGSDEVRIRLPQQKPPLKAYRSVAEGEGSFLESRDVFVEGQDQEEGDPIDTQVTGNLPEVLFTRQVGDAITPMVAQRLDAAGLFNLSAADAVEDFS